MGEPPARDEGLPLYDRTSNAVTVDRMATERAKNVLSVVVLVVGFLLAAALMVGAFLASFCGLFGEECTGEEEQAIGLLFLGSTGVFLGVPLAVAAVRQQLRWLLAPVIEVAIVWFTFALVDWF